MPINKCPHEKELLAKINSGVFDSDMERHIRECPSCREAAVVSQWLKRFSEVSRTAHLKKKGLPDPEELCQAAYRVPSRRERDLKRAMLPLRAARFTALIAGGGAASLLLFPSLFTPLGLTTASNAEAARSAFLEGLRLFMVCNPAGMIAILAILIMVFLSQIKKILIRTPEKAGFRH